jgi:hypothetical protein
VHDEDVIRDIREDDFNRQFAQHEDDEYGTGTVRAARLAAEVAEYGEDITLPCNACATPTHIAALVTCPECGLLLCATCPADCYHGLDRAGYLAALDRNAGGEA